MKSNRTIATRAPIAFHKIRASNFTLDVKLFKPVKVKGEGFVCGFEFSDPSLCGFGFGEDSLQSIVRALAEITQSISRHTDAHDQAGAWHHTFLPIMTQTEMFSTALNIRLIERIGNFQVPRQNLLKQPGPLERSIKKTKSHARQEVIAERRFLLKARRITAQLLSPIKLDGRSSGYRCEYRIVGLQTPMIAAALGENQFQAIYLAYYMLWLRLAVIRPYLTYDSAHPKVLGLPVCPLWSNVEGVNVLKCLSAILESKL